MNLLYTVNIGDFVSKRARDSFLSACKRWDCDYAELIHKRVDGAFESANKLCGAHVFSGFGKVMFLDGDAVISEHATNPFNLCLNPNTIYAVSDYQSPNRCQEWEELAYNTPLTKIQNSESAKSWFASSKNLPPMERFFNGGLFMFQPSQHIAEMFSWVLTLLPKNCSKFEEQAALNYGAHNGHGVAVEILPETWNHIIPQGNGSVSEYYINHYAGWAQSLLKQQ